MSSHLSLRQLFFILTLSFCGLLAASALSAWTGPTASAPDGNVAAPINVGTTDQVKDAGLSLNSLLVVGNAVLYNTGVNNLKLGVNVASPVVSLETSGTIKIGSGGEVCQAVTEGAQRYNATSKVMQYCNGTAWTTLSIGGTTKICSGTDGSSAGCSPSTSFPILCSYGANELPNSTGGNYSGLYMRWSGSNWQFWYHTTQIYYNCNKVLMYTPA